MLILKELNVIQNTDEIKYQNRGTREDGLTLPAHLDTEWNWTEIKPSSPKWSAQTLLSDNTKPCFV